MFSVSWRAVTVCLGLAAGLVGVAGCGSASPDLVYQSFSSAVKSNNFAGTWQCLSPQARGTVLQIMVLDADDLSASNQRAKDAFNLAYGKVGLNPQDATFRQARLQVSNPAALATELDGVFRQFSNDLNKLSNSRYARLQAIWQASASASLSPSQKQGTRATAAIQGKIPHTAEGKSIQAVFEKVNGNWLLAELEEQAAAPAMAGGPAGAGGPGMPGGPAMAGGPGGPAGAAAMPMPPAGGPATGGTTPAAAPAVPAGGPAMAQADPKNMPGGAPAGAPAAVVPAAPAGGPAMAAADPKNMPAGAPAAVVPAAPAGGPAMAAADPKNMPANPNAAGAGGAAAAGAGAGNNDPIKMGAGGRPAGGVGGDAGGNGQNKGKPGSFEHTVLTFAEKMASGDTAGIEYVISSKAKGLLGEIRDGSVSPERMEDLKATFNSPSPQQDSVKNTGSALIVTVKGKLGHSIVLTTGKEDGVFKIKDMKILEPGASKKR